METEQVSIGPLAERRLAVHGLTREDLRAAWASGTEYEGQTFLRRRGTLPDGRGVLLDCPFDRPQHIIKFRLLDDGE